ncbi:hypothetical protein CNYM01_03801 [Colletotrichum nymphaeae SA-01]|uniref:NACHT domain-containing protein n=1 Tax=Colletotrichum nymphaeae SA-01 TaxID=1460502 RepID=A0A135T3P2_9PEZI|nr:hypothetical protein CNYM01_03801 [Colletotrichum nymphaeae SA-01]
MTPLEIIGLVSAIITFIDFAAENVAVAREIGRTGSATFKDNVDLERRVKLVEEHVTGLNTNSIGAPRDTNEAQLLDLVEEYKSLTVQLMTLLAGLKSTKKRHILSKMVKDFRKKDEKETLQKELDDCRSRIHLQLTQLTRSESSHSDGSGRVRRGPPKEDGQDSNQYKTPNSGATSDGSSDEEYDYEQQISLERTAKELQAQEGLIDWLAHGGGIFHISGKPGAGKSTLMKYLCQSIATESYLKEWAGEKTLILANFFFWKLGSTAQKSLDGLLRALSYSILEQVPALLETVFPKQWSKASQGRAFSIQSSEIEPAFSHLLQHTAFFSSHKIAFFIDGLDEFDGDHDKMVKMLRNWSKSAPEDLKLCVSSREWEVFRQRLVNCPGIRLQDITSRDIEAYINSELSDNEEFRSYPSEDPKMGRLIDEIKCRAEGVFLWVKITLRGLKWGLLSGERLEDLEARLDALPAGLEELFTSILASITTGIYINKSDRTRAMRMLVLATEQARGYGSLQSLPVLLTEFAFLDDYEKDPNFVFSFPTASRAPESWVSRQDGARRSVYQRCMGLLEVQSSEGDARPRLMRGVCNLSESTAKSITSREEHKYNISEELNKEIQRSLQNGSARIHQEGKFEIIDKGDGTFLHTHAWYSDRHRINDKHPSSERVLCTHRSVVEFLSQPHNKSLIDAGAQPFDLADFRLQAFLASLKLFQPCKGFIKGGVWYKMERFVKACFQFRELGQDRLLTSCEELVRILQVQTPTPSIGSRKLRTIWFPFDPSELVYVTETDGSLGFAVYIDLIVDSWPISLDGGLYQLGRQSKRDTYHNVLLDFCLYEKAGQMVSMWSWGIFFQAGSEKVASEVSKIASKQWGKHLETGMESLSMSRNEAQLYFTASDSARVDKVTVGAAILRHDTSTPSILLPKRNSDEKYYPDVFEIPGGKIDATDSTIREAIIREVAEETQMKVLDITTPLSSIRYTTEKIEETSTGQEKIVKRHALQLSYIVTVEGTEFQVEKKEHSMGIWATRDSLDQTPITLEMRKIVLEALDIAEDR